MKSPVVKRSVVLAGHKTSVSLEDAFWQGLNRHEPPDYAV
jgi:predicted DNA-binding ribbon-helix-helix protein